MAKLHELLAVEGQLKNQAEKLRNELANSFEKKRHLFGEELVTFFPYEEGAAPVVEKQLDLQTTVRGELQWISEHLARAMNAGYQVAETNTSARASVVLESGACLLRDLPATALLELEKRVAEVKDLVSRIPTLDPAKGFSQDPNRPVGVYVAREDSKTRTRKVQEVIVKYPATPEHPAQTELISVDKPVGRIQSKEWSALLTPAQKADMLDRAEKLLRAVRQARARANECEIPKDRVEQKLGETILKYVFGF